MDLIQNVVSSLTSTRLAVGLGPKSLPYTNMVIRPKFGSPVPAHAGLNDAAIILFLDLLAS